MIAVSDRWKEKQKNFLAPEGFVEISYLISEDGLQDEVVSSSTNEAVFSDVENIVLVNPAPKKRWATTELNLWALDGSMNILPDSGEYENVGYVSGSFDSGSARVTAAEVHEQSIKGVTITWSEEYGEYAKSFTVTAYNGSSVVAQKTVTDNASIVSTVEMELSYYDSVEITVHEWSLPQHRPRIEQVILGVSVVFTKNNITNYTHSQSGCVVCGELSKNSIDFSLDNSSGEWQLNNPQGNGKYLTERQKLKVRYGFDIDGEIEWINAGTFYLTEWRTPANGIEVSFSARDILCYMIDKDYTGITSGTLYEIASAALEEADLPSSVVIHIDERLKEYTASFENNGYSIAEVLQYCANAACCVMYQDHDGEFWIKYGFLPVGDYRITPDISYSYPEFELLKQMKSVSVAYGPDEAKYVHAVGDIGEVQTLSNPFISTEAQAEKVAKWVENNLKFRKTISGEFRSDPRLDLFDRIGVESKYGVNDAVILTNVTYTFTGAFKGSYEGVVTEFTPVSAGYSGEYRAGEV